MSSATAHAASSSVTPCDQVGRDLQCLKVPVEAMTVDEVDHVPVDPQTIDEPSAETDALAPILHLTPRVTNILRDVFGTVTEEPVPDTSPHTSSSPLADSDENENDVEPADAEIERSELPRFQQQMFRTDI